MDEEILQVEMEQGRHIPEGEGRVIVEVVADGTREDDFNEIREAVKEILQ